MQAEAWCQPEGGPDLVTGFHTVCLKALQEVQGGHIG